IILSHSRIYEDIQRAEAREAKKNAPRKPAARKEDSPVIQNQAASTTLGDLDALAALKAKMQNSDE
ncbi:MAG: 30S ribosomal protein S1, partial [Bacteroidaceae bacterium]|nr:30S ribosomal protein S1 [Bacteroidaceae bacterium]